tara:strand:- start:123 stop:368 length:246 start_codon:yes stop_codon:yes gene_type:complete
MKKTLFILIILLTITNISYAAFPIENELFEVLNQIDNTEIMEETFSNDPESKTLLLKFGIIGLLLSFLVLFLAGVIIYSLQ